MMDAEPTAEYLAAYRHQVSPPATRRRANLERIRARLAEPQHEAGQQQVRGRRAASMVVVAKSVSLSLMLGGLGLGAIKLGAMTFVPQPAEVRPAPGSSVEPDTVDAPETVDAPRVQPKAVPPDPAGPAETRAPQLPAVAEPAAAGLARPRKPADFPKAATAPTPDRLRAEVDLMQRIARAVEQGQWLTALSLTAEHEMSFASGALTEERRAWGTIATCGLGKPEGPPRAAAFVRAYPRSPLVARVQQACGESKKTSTDPHAPQE